LEKTEHAHEAMKNLTRREKKRLRERLELLSLEKENQFSLANM
jgi:hypothetical protein